VDASESSWADPRPIDQPLARQEAYITVDALKNFMSTMTDAIASLLAGKEGGGGRKLRKASPTF